MTKQTLDKILAGDPKQVLERFLTSTSTGQQFIKEIDDERTAARAVLAQSLKDAEARHTKELLALVDRQTTAHAAREEAQRLVVSAQQEIHFAGSALHRSITVFSREKAAIEKRLLELVDSRIVEFDAWLHEELNLCRKPRTTLSGSDTSLAEMRVVLSQRARAIGALIPQVKHLYLEPLSADEVAERIESYKKSLPPTPDYPFGSLLGRSPGFDR